jgi:hypothetical protein
VNLPDFGPNRSLWDWLVFWMAGRWADNSESGSALADAAFSSAIGIWPMLSRFGQTGGRIWHDPF